MADVVRTEGVMGGEPRLAGRRISVLQIAELVLDGGKSPAYAADQLDISLGDVHGALAYYYEHPAEMEAVRARQEDLQTQIEDAAASPDHVEQ